MDWEKYQGGNFRSTVGRERWGEKAGNVMEGKCDADKLDVVFFIKIPKAFLKGAGSVPEREAIKILPPEFLMEKEKHFYLQKEKMVKGYILKKDAPVFSS